MPVKALSILIILCSISCLSSAQTSFERNRNLGSELGKNGMIINLVFDQMISIKKVGVRTFVGSNFGKSLFAYKMGMGAFKLLGNDKRYFEMGLDLEYFFVHESSDDVVRLSNLVYPNDDTSIVLISINTGYRAYGEKSIFRVGLSPILANHSVFLGGYISIGFWLRNK